jgi:hypothetical protein
MQASRSDNNQLTQDIRDTSQQIRSPRAIFDGVHDVLEKFIFSFYVQTVYSLFHKQNYPIERRSFVTIIIWWYVNPTVFHQSSLTLNWAAIKIDDAVRLELVCDFSGDQ